MNNPVSTSIPSGFREIESSSYPPSVNSSFGKRFLKGEVIIGTCELATMSILILLPKSTTKWPDNYLEDAIDNIGRAFSSPPVWDSDDFFFNYVGHPYAGSVYYNAMRAQGASGFESAVFCTFQSTLWEYVIEGVAERPSIQDLIVTPVAGTILGELTHRWTGSMRKGGFNTLEKVIVTILNPTYVLLHGYR
jgi:hypothetical protein